MKVLLKNKWFTPHGRFKRSVPKDNPVYIPEILREHLPSTAKIVGDDHRPEELKVKNPRTFAEFNEMHGIDPLRAAGEAEQRVRDEADEAERVRKAIQHKDEMEAVKAAKRAAAAAAAPPDKKGK